MMTSSTHSPPRLLVLQTTSIFESYGGIEYYLDDFLTLVTELYGEGAASALVPQRGSSPLLADRPYPVSFIPYRAKGLWGKLENRISPRFLRAVLQAVRFQRPNLLVCGHVSLGPMTYLAHRLTGIPYVSCAYGIECWGKLPAPDKLALRHALKILSISRWTRKILIERGFLPNSVAVIHPRLPTHLEQQPIPSKRERLPGEPLRLLTISRLDSREQYKGQDHVIEAMHRLRRTEPNLKFHYTIQGDGSDRSRLEELVRSRGLNDCVEFHSGRQSRMDLESLYHEADLYIMPSRFGYWEGRWRGEGFGIVYLEAAAFGLASVAYDCGGVTDIIQSGNNGILVEPDNIDELARTLSFLARNPKRLNELGCNAFQAVMRDFTRPAIRVELRQALLSLGLTGHSGLSGSAHIRAS